MRAEDVVSMVTYAADAPVFETPADYGLEFEDVEFTSEDGVPLSGWFLPGSNSRVVVQTHFGGICSRAGYTPSNKGHCPAWPTPIHFLRHIKVLVGAGYSVLAYDLRNHGRSGADPAAKLTHGVRESRDVLAAVRYVVDRPDLAGAPVGLLSFCMGANATTYGFGASPGLAEIAAVRALIVVQPMPATDQMRAMGVPDRLVGPANELNQDQGGADLTTSFLPAVASINVPTMLVQNTRDPMLNHSSIAAYFDRLMVEKRMVWLDLEPARLAAYDYFANDPRSMVGFFDTHLR